MLSLGLMIYISSKAITTFTVNEEALKSALARNPILVTALNLIIGYEKAAKTAKQAYAEGLPVLDVAERETDIPRAKLETLLDPAKLTMGGI